MLHPLFLKAIAITKQARSYLLTGQAIHDIAFDPTLSDEQMEVYTALEDTGGHAFITGKAGTGKSVLLRYFASHTNKSAVIVAPTGIAALSIQGQTIHSLFKLPIGFRHSQQITISPKTKQLLSHVETVIIDEVSMVRADTIDAIDYILRIAKNSYAPFGNTQIIAFGDVYQLPPVVEKSLRSYFETNYGGPYFFNAKVWKRTKLTTYELQRIFRQSDEAFKAVLNTIRDGHPTPYELNVLEKRVIATTEIPENTMTLTATNATANDINMRRLNALAGRQKTYNAIMFGTMPENSHPANTNLTLKKGAQVVFV